MDVKISSSRIFNGGILFFFVLIFVFMLQYCTTSTGPEEPEPEWTLKIGHLGISTWVFQGSYIDVPIFISSDSRTESSKFNIKIAYDAEGLTFIKGEAGEILEGWPELEYSHSIHLNDPPMLGVIEVAGANGSTDNSNSIGPFIEADSDSVLLVNLKFYVTDDREYGCTFVPLHFYWESCGDNLIGHSMRDCFAYSDKIYEIDLMDPYNQYVELMPSDGTIGFDDHILGTFDVCRDNVDNLGGTVDFYHGGVDIACGDYIDFTLGDINLDEIANEVGDAVLLSNFFLFGESVFTINQHWQILATDVNRDGIFPTLADLEYMIRIMAGNAIPASHLEHFADTVDVIVDGDLISLDIDVRVGPTLFIFEGEVGFLPIYDGVEEQEGNFQNDETRVLLYPRSDIEPGIIPVLRLALPAKLKSCESSGYYGNMVVTKIIE
ncbi:MAG: hypothetical protein GF310_11615 [candidate division Zixibacteria bacterium]|nr:hypothetical protein [candidate division Zixibacteria bacterium]